MSTLDAIIIGSGFGGSFCAEHLVATGLRVAMVERGPWRDTLPVRSAGVAERSPLPHGRHMLSHFVNRLSSPQLRSAGWVFNASGLYDVHLQRDINVICTNSVGGGSHVYTAMNTPPAVKAFWDNRADGLNDQSMSTITAECIKRMGSRPPQAEDHIPNFIGTRFDARSPFAAHPEQPAMGYNLEHGPFQSNSFFGCETGGKVTLDTHLIVPLIQKGLAFYDLHEAVDITRTKHNHWRVTMLDRRTDGYRQLEAPRLILAAGTLNTLRLLFAARERRNVGALPALGLNFGGNGDSLSYWALQELGTDYSMGTPCHGRFVIRGKDDCPNLTSYGISGVDHLLLPENAREWLKHGVLLVGMGADEANGQVTWRKGRLRITYSAQANPVLSSMQHVFDEITALSGKKVYYLPRLTLTVHPLGGARVDDDQRRGIVNGHGEVHHHPGLYVADASAFPAAPGSPPSMSIATWARHVANGIARQG